MRKYGVGEITEIEKDSKKEAKAVEWTAKDEAELKKELDDSDSDKTEDAET